MPLTVGGGVRQVADIRKLLLAGADKVSSTRRPVKKPEFVAEAPTSWATSASSSPSTPRTSRRKGDADRWEILPWRAANDRHRRDRICAKVVELGAAKSSHLHGPRRYESGYDISLTRAIADAVRPPVIASGGVGTLDHMVEGIRDGHATAVLAASIFHFGTYSIASEAPHGRARHRHAA